MKPVSVNFVPIVAAFLGLVLAAVFGVAIIRSQTQALAVVVVAMGIWIYLVLGRNVWLLIPLCWPLTGQIPILPIPFTVAELAIFAAFGMTLMLYVFKRVAVKPSYSWLEWLMLINVAWIVVMYLRNPVGFRAFETETVGGRPYFNVIVACLAFWVLIHVTMSPRQARWFPILMTAGALVMGAIGVFTRFVPSATPFIARFYTGVNIESFIAGGSAPVAQVDRIIELKNVGGALSLLVLCFYRPLTLLNPFRIGRFLLFTGAIVAILLSGFRSQVLGTCAGFAMASYFWGGSRDLVRAAIMGAVGIVLLLVVQTAGFDLPLPAQRALSFLPGDWDRAAAGDAEGSVEWRVEMWETVLKSNLIDNKVLGDGFGFSARDLEIITGAMAGGQGYVGGSRFEEQLVTGAYHSGPLSAIRFGGYVGLVLFYALLLGTMVKAFQMISLCRGTPYFFIALYLALPMIYAIFSYTIIYGAYDAALPGAIFNVAMLHCVRVSAFAWRKRDSPEAAASQVPYPTFQQTLSAPSGARA